MAMWWNANQRTICFDCCSLFILARTVSLRSSSSFYIKKHIFCSGGVKFVRLGDLNLKTVTDDADPQNFNIVETFRHPDYKPPSQYNDIALVKLDKPVKYTQYVLPACLQTTHHLAEHETPSATGWGRLGYIGETSDELMKVNLSYFTNDQCRQVYANVPQRRLPNGIIDRTQLCAGGIDESKDTCQVSQFHLIYLAFSRFTFNLFIYELRFSA